MTRPTDRELMRLIHGELPPARARELARRLAADPALERRYRRLEATWESMELPPPAPPPPGFAGRIVARATEALAPRPTPAWVRAAGALALAAGLLLGISLERMGPAASGPESELALELSSDLAPESLAEAYWESLAEEANGEVTP